MRSRHKDFAYPNTDENRISSHFIRHNPNKEGIMSTSKLTSLGALALSLFLAGCQAQTAPAPKADRPVQVQRVTFDNPNATREFVGVVRARHETDLGFRVAGKIVSRLVNVGDRVRVGDVVARLDPQDWRLQV